MKRLRILIATLALVPLAATPAVADYSLRASTVSQGGGRGTSGDQSLTFVVGQPSPPVSASNATYGLSAGLVALLLDVTPPIILHSAPGGAVPDRTALEITAAVGDDRTGVAAATVFYREGGSLTYRERAMAQDGSSFSASIPPSGVTERGLLYYIEAADSAGNRSRYPADAPDNLIDVRVWFSNLESAFELPAGQYRMISLPGSTDADPDQVLVDDLGEYNIKVWRLGRWNPSAECSATCYEEYPDVPDMDRGKAFWLISRDAIRFDFTGLSTLPESPFRVHLEEGWNQIGTPFAFTTDWLSTEVLFEGETYALNEEHVVGADTIYVEDNLVSYDGAYQGQQSVMEPWQGYWIYNGSTRDVDLLLSPHGITPALASSLAVRTQPQTTMEIAVSSSDFPERTGVVGLSVGAKDGWDPMDHREPPPFGDYIRVVFEKPDWGRHRGTYMTDIRHSNEEGALWQFQVEASRSTSAEITIKGPDTLPQGWQIYLYDTARGLRITPADLPYRCQIDQGRGFSLIAGTAQFIRSRENEEGISLIPQIVGVAPNPFRQRVDISYFTPGTGLIELDVFSVEGRLVKTIGLTDEDMGIRRATWHGDSDQQGEVAPGLYFLRLRTGGSTHTAKVVKIQ
jgi:hypothetical protein